jgi:hypothetical protein
VIWANPMAAHARANIELDEDVVDETFNEQNKLRICNLCAEIMGSTCSWMQQYYMQLWLMNYA